MKDILIHQILELPQANLIMQEVLAILNKEKEKRERFYDEINEQQKVEFINGEIIMHSPVNKKHNRISSLLFKLLDTYVIKNDLGFVGIEKIMIALTRNDYEPDICFFTKEKSKNFTSSQSLFPAPDLIIEILSKSTEDKDRGIKYQDYEAHGVHEYWIIDPEEETIEQYILENGSYQLKLKSSEGHIRSVAVTQFEIPIKAIFDEQENMKVLRGFL